MLTGDLVRPRLRKEGGSLRVDMLDTKSKFWQRTAKEVTKLFRSQVGQTQREWENALEAYEGERVDYIVIRGLAKVLSDAATFVPIEAAHPPALVREKIFALGPAFTERDLFNSRTRNEVLQEVADELTLTPAQVEAALFADREYVLKDAGPAWKPEELLARYNLELARGALYWAAQMQIEVHDTFKDFWRFLKFFKLMFEAITLDGGGYKVTIDGPISPFVASTIRYGRQFAAFLPALLLCEQWKMSADVRIPQFGDALAYRLDHTTSLRSHFARSGTFDSGLEADFAAEFEMKFGGKRGQWELSREDEVLILGDTVMIPDFSLTNKRDGRKALLEIVGFWHPDYLRRKVEKVRAAQCNRLILLVSVNHRFTDFSRQTA